MLQRQRNCATAAKARQEQAYRWYRAFSRPREGQDQCAQAQKLAARMSPNHACLAPPRQRPPAAHSRTPAGVPAPDGGHQNDSISRSSASPASAVAGASSSDVGRTAQRTSDDGASPAAAVPPGQATAQQWRQSYSQGGSAAGSGVPAKPSAALHATTAPQNTQSPLVIDTRAADMLAIAEQLRRTLGMPAAVSTGARR